MKSLFPVALAVCISVSHAQETEGFDEYAGGMESKRTKLPVNINHKVNAPVSKGKRLLNGALNSVDEALAQSGRTYQSGTDVLNYGGLTVKGDTPVKANNIVIVTRPGGLNGLEGQHTRPTHVRPTSRRDTVTRPMRGTDTRDPYAGQN